MEPQEFDQETYDNIKKEVIEINENEKLESLELTQGNPKLQDYVKMEIYKLNNFSAKPMIYDCKICIRRFSQKGHFRNHLLHHIWEKPYQCGVCFKRFLRKNCLKMHEMTHKYDNSKNEKWKKKEVIDYSCYICNRVFYERNVWRVHVRDHLKEGNYTCFFCKENFKLRSMLFYHLVNYSYLCKSNKID